jgi:hypothetical protein
MRRRGVFQQSGHPACGCWPFHHRHARARRGDYHDERARRIHRRDDLTVTMIAVTEDSSGLHVRQTPRKRASAEIKDFSVMVRVPGQPAAVRVFTDDERVDADAYAADTGGTVVPLPLLTSPEVPHTGGDSDNAG